MILPSGNRRRNIVFAIAALLLAWIIVGGALMPLREEADRMDRKIREARNDLRKMREMADRYITLDASLPREMKTDSSRVSLLTDVENISRRLAIENKIKRMTPEINPATKKQDDLSVVIAEIPYPAFVGFLQALYESSAAINVRQAKITASFDNRGNLNVEMTLSKAF
jgi:type II secretory pathway component PulM